MSMLNMLLGINVPSVLKWSGNSLYSGGGQTYGIRTSENSYRMEFDAVGTVGDQVGAWQTVNTSGIFSGDSLLVNYGLGGSSSGLRSVVTNDKGTKYYGSWVTYSTATKTFNGSSLASFDDGDGGWAVKLETSGGLIRIGLGAASPVSFGFGSYISLT